MSQLHPASSIKTFLAGALSYASALRLKKRNILPVVLAAGLGFSAASAQAVESWNKTTLYVDRYNSPVWTSGQFDSWGGMYRNFHGQYLYASVWHDNGGWDTAIQGNYSIDKVDNVKKDYWVGAKYNAWGSGSGYWYMGPKVSVNWQGGNNDGASGWWENYIVEYSKQKPWELHSWLTDKNKAGGRYLGEDWFSGIHYKFYLRPFAGWNQLWAVRQYDPNNYYPGSNKVWTPVKKILEAWRYHGLPNKRVDSIRMNVETDKQNNRQFEIKEVSMPASFN